MKKFLKSQAPYCLPLFFLFIGLLPATAQEPVKTTPAQPTTTPKTTMPADPAQPGKEMPADNTRTTVGADTLPPGKRINPLTTKDGAGRMTAETAIKDWPETARLAADAAIAEYGQPVLSSNDMLIWRDNGPWKKTVIVKSELQREWPKPHKAVIEQTAYYKVPQRYIRDIARFDSGIMLDSANGTVTIRSDRQEHNYLMLNLLDEIVQGKRTPESARAFWKQTVTSATPDAKNQYTDGLMFMPQRPDVDKTKVNMNKTDKAPDQPKMMDKDKDMMDKDRELKKQMPENAPQPGTSTQPDKTSTPPASTPVKPGSTTKPDNPPKKKGGN